MSNNINENNCIFVVKDTNKECSIKMDYSLLIVLTIIELCIEIFFFRYILLKFPNGEIILILIVFLSILYLIFSIYFMLKLKICCRTRKEILSKININKMKSYKKVTKILMFIGLFISIIYFLYTFFNIFFNDKIFPNCETLFSKQNLDHIMSLKTCQNNKCYNIKSNYKNTKYNNNYICNINLYNTFSQKEDKNKIDCTNIPKEQTKSLYMSSKAFHNFFKEKNSIILKELFYFMISCDYDLNKELYICNTLNELKENENSISYIEIINDYNKVNSFDHDSKEKKEDDANHKDKNGECMTIINFLLSIICNLIIFFTLPIKVDIWFNEYRRFEIVKKQIHPNRLRVRSNEQNNNNYNNLDALSVSTEDNTSDKSSDSSISDNGQGGNNVLESVIQN